MRDVPAGVVRRERRKPEFSARASMRVWVGPSHCPPSSTGVPSAVVPPSARLPTRPLGLKAHSHLDTGGMQRAGRGQV